MVNFKGMAKRGWNGLKKTISPKTITPEKYVQKEAFSFLPTPATNITQDVSLQMASLRPSNVGSAPSFIKGGSLEVASLTPSNIGDAPSFVMGGIENAEARAVGKLKSNVVESVATDVPFAELGSYSSSNIPVKVNNPKIPLDEAPKTDTILNSIKENGIPDKRPSTIELLPEGSGIQATAREDLANMTFTNPLTSTMGNYSVRSPFLTGAGSTLDFNRGSEVVNRMNLYSRKIEEEATDALSDVMAQKEKFKPVLKGNTSKTAQEAAQEEAQEKGSSWARNATMVMGGVLGGAALTAALSSNRGQQTNAQLYGQQPLY